MDWDTIKTMYEGATRRVGTPYEPFGHGMLELIALLREEINDPDFIIGTAVYALTLSLANNPRRWVKVTWLAPDTYELVLATIEPITQEELRTVSKDDVLATIQQHLSKRWEDPTQTK